MNFKTVSLQYCSIPSTIYNVPATSNTIHFRHSTIVGDLSAALTPGFYTSGTFPAAVQSAINAVIGPATVTVAWNSVTFRLTVTCTAGQTIEILSGANNCFQTGWGLQGPALAVTGTTIMDLSGPSEVYLDIGFLQKTVTSAARLNFASFVVPLTQISGQYNDFYVNNTYLMASESSTLQEITCAIRDDTGAVVDLNGGNVTIILRGN
jgi:hypothetical protein